MGDHRLMEEAVGKAMCDEADRWRPVLKRLVEAIYTEHRFTTGQKLDKVKNYEFLSEEFVELKAAFTEAKKLISET